MVAVLNEVQEVIIEKLNIIDENTVEIEGNEYMVLTEDEATMEFKNYQQNLIDDMGLQGFSEWYQNDILNNHCNLQWFEDAMKESYESYIEDIQDEEGRLSQEMGDLNVETEEDYIKYLCEQNLSGAEWFKDNFGDEEFSNTCKEYCSIDWDAIIQEVEQMDGRGCLASYDGNENEQEVNGVTYYIYQTN